MDRLPDLSAVQDKLVFWRYFLRDVMLCPYSGCRFCTVDTAALRDHMRQHGDERDLVVRTMSNGRMINERLS